ncbi:DUF4834 family protein [Parabacteroides sp. OttesenSCG-928-G06]|nr:DUF4834 family protein [Parabacteroides sp. OttesenSCG-928-G06]
MIRFLLICVFFFVILMFLMGFSVFRTFREIFFGSPKRRASATQNSRTNNQSTQQQRPDNNPPQRKKIFTKDEGEYVDYEEMKE